MKIQNNITPAHLAKGMSYSQYLELIDRLISEGKATGGHDSDAYLNYSTLNRARMKRIDKTFKLDPALQKELNGIVEPMIWLVITEGWCGDAAQNVPVIAALAEASPNVELKIILRDENLEVMNAYLTNGGMGIPKLVCLRASDLAELGTWGPRPVPAQEMVMEHKRNPQEPYREFVLKVQGWYNQDKNETMQAEFKALLKVWVGAGELA